MIHFDVKELIPQREPMIMVDALTACGETVTETRFTVSDNCIMVENDCLTAEGMLENVAQTCACRLGYFNKIAGKTVKIGYIGAVKDYKVNRLPVVGERLLTRVEIREEIFGITLVDATVLSEGETLSTCSMKIAISDIDAINE